MSTLVGRRFWNICNSHSYHSTQRHFSFWRKGFLKPVINVDKSRSASCRQLSSTFNRPPQQPPQQSSNYLKKAGQLWKSPVSPIMTSTSDSETAATQEEGKSSPPTIMPTLPENVQAAKDKYLNMEIDVKRSYYRCGEKYTILDNVLDWPNYFVKAKVAQAKVVEENANYPISEELNSKVSLWQGDITALEIDAIVNAANSSLLGGGGVDGAIHRAAGRRLLYECRELNGCHEGEAKITGGYQIPSRYIVHTVGPQEEKKEILRSCYVNSLELMLQNNLRSIAFPCIGTGIYGYPRIGAAVIALTTVREFLKKNADKVDRVIFTVFLNEDKKVYETLMQKYFPLQLPEKPEPEKIDGESKPDEPEPEPPKAKTEEAEPKSPKAKESKPDSPKNKD